MSVSVSVCVCVCTCIERVCTMYRNVPSKLASLCKGPPPISYDLMIWWALVVHVCSAGFSM